MTMITLHKGSQLISALFGDSVIRMQLTQLEY